MRKENRSQGSGGKQGEINLPLKISHFKLGLCPTVNIVLIPLVTPRFQKDETEASIRVSRMFKSHI
jgi:hypothetical protein